MLISCGCLLLFKHASDGVCTWAKSDGHTYRVLSLYQEVSSNYNVL